MTTGGGEQAIWLITGIMASGKSTVAQLLAERLDKAAHLRGDVFRRMIVSGREEMTPQPNGEALRQLRLRYKIAANVADTYFQSGFSVVLQDVILGPELAQLVAIIHAKPLYVIVLAPSVEVVEAREQARGKVGYGAWSAADLDRVLRVDTPKIGIWIDSTHQTPEETVDEIIRRTQTATSEGS